MLLEELTSYCYWLATATGSDYGSDTAPIIIYEYPGGQGIRKTIDAPFCEGQSLTLSHSGNERVRPCPLR